jgi:TorA maturation chaperone TorD
MRNPGLERATGVAVRSYAPAVAIYARAGDSVHSPPPSGDALGESDLPQPVLDGARAHRMDDIDTARAQEYALLSVLLARAPDAVLLSRLAELRGDASPLGLAHAALAEAASRANLERVEREYFDLFIGLGRGELLPYGSYYLSGFLHERPLARLRAYLAGLGIERAEGQPEPEDHAAILCEIMAGIISGRLPAPAGADRELFEHHLAPWVGRFFADLERAGAADLYRHVGVLGRVFVDIETRAFALPS